MSVSAIAALMTSVSTLVIGFFIYSKNLRSRVFLFFALICLAVSTWALSSFFLATAAGYPEAVFWNRAACFLGALIPVFFTCFIFELIGFKASWIFYGAIFGISFIFSGLSLTSFFAKNLTSRLPDYHYLPRPGLGYGFYVFYFFTLLAYVSYQLVGAYQKAHSFKKNKILFLILATVIGFLGMAGFFLTIYNFQPRLPFPHDYFMIMAILVFAYAISRHHLMDIEIVIKRTFVFAGLFGAIIIIYSLPLFIFQNLFQQTLGLSRWLAAAITILAMMVGYERLKNFLIGITDQHLFQKKYEYREALAELGRATNRLMKLETFAKIINRNVVRVIKLAGGSAAVLDKKKNQYEVLAAIGSHEGNAGKILPRENALILGLEKADYLLADDLEEDFENGRPTPPEREKIKNILEIFKEFNAVLCVPTRLDKEIVGFMLFGEKLSREAYSEEDLDLFVTISRQIALAINNSYLYEESLEKERELAKKELEKQTEKIRRLASLGELAAGVAHEIRNPMTVLRSRAEDLKSEIKNKGYLLEFADLSVKHIDRILSIVNNMLRFAKEREKTAFSEVNVNDVVNDTLTLVEGRFKSKGLEIAKNLFSEKKVTGDPNLLQQAFLNIALNSYDFMETGGRLTINTLDLDGQVLVEFVDTGAGIPQEKIGHIFDPFFTTRAEGTGLGLSITHRIIQDHGGRLEVTSEIGKGTKFRIFLPGK